MNFKKKAFDLMKQVQDEDHDFPNYFSKITKKEHSYSIISSMVVS